MHARRSRPAEPDVARFGNGKSVPIRELKIFSSTERRRTSVKADPSLLLDRSASVPSAGARARLHFTARGAVTLGGPVAEPSREHRLRAFAEGERAAGPKDRERVRLAVEAAIAADLVRGN